MNREELLQKLETLLILSPSFDSLSQEEKEAFKENISQMEEDKLIQIIEVFEKERTDYSEMEKEMLKQEEAMSEDIFKASRHIKNNIIKQNEVKSQNESQNNLTTILDKLDTV